MFITAHNLVNLIIIVVIYQINQTYIFDVRIEHVPFRFHEFFYNILAYISHFHHIN